MKAYLMRVQEGYQVTRGEEQEDVRTRYVATAMLEAAGFHHVSGDSEYAGEVEEWSNGPKADPIPMPPIVKRCECERIYTSEGWAGLEVIGQQINLLGPPTEVRRCHCGAALDLGARP